ncbi:MAG: hypothetical protein ABIE94_01915 [archaeon]
MGNRGVILQRPRIKYSHATSSLTTSLEQEIPPTDERFKLFYKDLVEVLSEELAKPELLVPVSIFRNDISPLRSLVKYLRENVKLSLSRIAKLLARDPRTIWTTYAAVKQMAPLKPIPTPYSIPVARFEKIELSVLETIVHHLREEMGLRNVDIARILGKDQKTVWTAYDRAVKKLQRSVEKEDAR